MSELDDFEALLRALQREWEGWAGQLEDMNRSMKSALSRGSAIGSDASSSSTRLLRFSEQQRPLMPPAHAYWWRLNRLSLLGTPSPA